MRKLDRLLASGVLAIAAHLLFGIGFALGVEFAIKSMTDWWGRVAWVQGQPIRLDATRTRPEEPIPAILPDGSFDPQYSGPIQELPEFSNGWTYQVARSRYSEDEWRRLMARWLTGAYVPPGTTGQWTWDTPSGIRHFDATGEVDGALTDDGFVRGGDPASSFNEAVFAYPDQYTALASNAGGVLVYATPRAFYRADLIARTIVKLAEFSEEPVSYGAGGLRDFGSPVPRVFVLTPSSVHWFDTDRAGGFGSFEMPEAMRSLHGHQTALGADGRVIVRAWPEEPVSPGVARFNVAVFESDGRLVDSYEYDIDYTDLVGVYQSLGERTGQDLGVTFAGRLVQAVMPPAWRIPLDPAEAFISPMDYAFRRGWLKTIGGLWTALIVSGIAAALVAWLARRRGAGWAGTIAWAAAVVALGIPMAPAAYFIIRPARREACAGCGARQSAARATCRRCGAAAPGPAKLGIEIT